MSTIHDLEPKRLWHYFDEICSIPHGSGNEESIRKYLMQVAHNLGLECKRDTVGNVVIRKPATDKFKGAKTLIFQAHMDMVVESDPSIKFDPLKDRIKTKVSGEWLTADNTTLGADNGIGMAAMLAILEDKSIQHGPIECLFTTTEETGLDGAFGLQPEMLTGRTMINLDSEEDGVLFVGCAGGADSLIDFPVAQKELPKEFLGLKLVVSGLRGGHSGLNIHEQRGNALKILGRILYAIHEQQDLHLCDVQGGTRRNVIPSHAEAIFAVKKHKRAKVVTLVEELADVISAELKTIDPDLKIEVSDVEVKDSFGLSASAKIVSFMNAAPHGVITMSYDIPDLVQTSTNFAVTKFDVDHFSFQFLNRSSSTTEVEKAKSSVAAHAELLGVEAECPSQYPGWQPNLSSPILKLMKSVHTELFGKEPEHKAIHAGLECGIIGEKFGGMDMVSCGPVITGAHSVKEQVHIKSVQDMYKYLVRTLEKFAEGK